MIIYNKELTNFSEIAHAISVQMIAYYNDIGKITLTLPVDEYNIAAVENDGLIYDVSRGLAFTVQNYKLDTPSNAITVNGYTSNWLLNRRVVAEKAEIKAIEQDIYSVVNANLRGLYKVSCGSALGFKETTEVSLYGGQLLDEIMPILEEAKIGNEMVWDPDACEHVFTLYKGRDLTSGIHAVVFSEEFGTASDTSITKDKSVFSNVIYVRGKLSDDTEILEIVGDEADDRSEWWLSEVLNQEDEENKETLRERMRQRGLEEIAARVARTTFSAKIDPSEYGTLYKLGDIVSCVSLRFNVEMTARISGLRYTMDQYGESVSLILGEPVLTALGEVKLRNG